MTLKLPIGYDDFRKARERGVTLIDKTGLIREVIDQSGREVLLMPRPRRFGKSMNLSMLRYYFERTPETLDHLFEGLEIWDAGAVYRAHFQRYPVIYLSFKGIKHPSFDLAMAKIRLNLQALFEYHAGLLEADTLSPQEAERYRAVMENRADQTTLERSLLELTGWLHRHHGERAIILIDEYDEPIHAAWSGGYPTEMLGFFRNFLTDALKSNPHLHRAVLTGRSPTAIPRVVKEPTPSIGVAGDLNNVGVYTVLRPEFSEYFGFSEAEVQDLLQRMGQLELLEVMRTWYNGYLFGGQAAGGRRSYNPWSVCNFLDSEDKEPRSYWVNSSANELIRHLLEHYALTLQPDLERLLDGEALELPIDENVVLNALEQSPTAFWSLLLFSGYLTAQEIVPGPGEPSTWRLSIPNREEREVYTSTFQVWLETRLLRQGERVGALTRALLEGDAEELEILLQAFVTDVLSVHDTRRAPLEEEAGLEPGIRPRLYPENIYQGFVSGLLATLEPAYRVRSNREWAEVAHDYGRPDVLIRPKQPGRPGAVLELEVAKRKKTLEQALKEGLEQTKAKQYAAELRAAGAEPIHAFVVAFDGKQVAVRGVDAGSRPDHEA